MICFVLFAVQAKLDEYALEIKGKVCESTQRTVYEQVSNLKRIVFVGFQKEF